MKLFLFPLLLAVFVTDALQAQDLESRIQQLEKELRQLKKSHQDTSLKKAQEAPYTLIDGDHHPVGWDKHFYVESSDKNYRFQINGQIQLRYTDNHRQNEAEASESGFSMRRTRIDFQGHVFSPKLKYKIQMDFHRSDGDAALEESFMQYQFGSHIYVVAGQFIGKFFRDGMTSSKKTLTVDRTLTNDYFRLGEIQGVGLEGRHEKWDWSFLVHDGRKSFHTGFTRDHVDAAAAVRLQWYPGGKRVQFMDYVAWSTDPGGIKLGAAVDYEDGKPGESYKNFTTWTADLAYEQAPFNLFTTYVSRSVKMPGTADIKQSGFFLQGGVFVIKDKLDLVARWEHVEFDGHEDAHGFSTLRAGADDELDMYIFGANYYFRDHSLKLAMDYTVAPHGIAQGKDGLGYITSNNMDAQHVFRMQMQVLF